MSGHGMTQPMTLPANTGTAPVALRFALRDLRGALRGFRIFLACLILGVGAVAAAGSVNEAVRASMDGDAKRLLGGDLEFRLGHRDFTSAEQATLAAHGTVGRKVETRTMAARTDDPLQRILVELKAVDDAYPLYGDMVLDPPVALSQALAVQPETGLPGAVLEPTALARLGLEVGDVLTVGGTTVEVTAGIVTEPDRLVSAFSFGPRLMISTATLEQTGLVQTGSMVRRHLALRIEDGRAPDAIRTEMDMRFPDATFRVRGLSEAAEGLDRFMDNMTLFLTLVGLAALLIGGIGIAGAVRAHVDSRVTTIAALKCLGAPSRTIWRMFAVQVAVLSLIGIVAGCALGAFAPMALNAIAGDMLPVKAAGGLFPFSLGKAALFGLLITAIFAALPLSAVHGVRARALFDGLPTGMGGQLSLRGKVAVGLLAALLCLLVVGTAERPGFALWFLAGSAVAFVVFLGAARGMMALARRLDRPGGALVRNRPGVRMALAALHRPGAATAGVVLSLGLGLSVLVTTALIEVNLSDQVRNRLPERAPAYFVIDIPPAGREGFERAVRAVDGVGEVRTAFMIRGPVRAINGVPSDQVKVSDDVDWVVRGDRGFSAAAELPRNAEIVAGQWWAPDHAGDALVSVTEDVAKGLGLDVGGTVTVNILGRDITARVASLRAVNWRSAEMNFAFIFSPNTLAGAPGSYLATIEASREAEPAVARVVGQSVPTATVIRVREALEAAAEIISGAGAAIRAATVVALASGVLVLGGAMAAGQARRRYESVVLKVIGARRRDVARAYLLEYGLLGAVAGVAAVVIGSVAAGAVVTGVMDLSWRFSPGVAAGIVVLGVLLTLLAGFAGTWRALGAPAAPYLREE